MNARIRLRTHVLATVAGGGALASHTRARSRASRIDSPIGPHHFCSRSVESRFGDSIFSIFLRIAGYLTVFSFLWTKCSRQGVCASVSARAFRVLITP